jgi:hypothetical protein
MVSSKKVAHRLIFFTFFRVESLEADLAAKMQEIKRCVFVRACAFVHARVRASVRAVTRARMQT